MTAALGNPFALGATGVLTTARTDRLAMGASFRPASAALAAVSGFLAGPANTQGELTLVSDAILRVAPFLAIVQGTRNSLQGQYVVQNTAQRDLAVPAKDASQSRRALIVVRVGDSLEAGVASSASTDGAWLEIVSGALASSNPQLPALPADAFAAGELLIPSTGSGQPVTLTRYNPRTTSRGGILPVLAGPAITTPGYEGAPGLALGEYRDHPTDGLQRWNGAAWGEPQPSVPIDAPLVAHSGLGNVRVPHYWRTGRTVHLQGVAYVPTLLNSGQRVVLFTMPVGWRPPASKGNQLVLPGAQINGWLMASVDVFADGRIQLRNDTAQQWGGNGVSGSWYSLQLSWALD